MGPCQHGPGCCRRGDDQQFFHQKPCIVGQRLHKRIIILLIFPIRNHLVLQYSDIFFRNNQLLVRAAWAQFTGIGDERALEFRVNNGISPGRPGTSDNHFIFIDMDGQIMKDVRQGLCPSEDNRLTFRFSHGFRQQARPFHIQLDGLFPEALQHMMNPGAFCFRRLTHEADGFSPRDSFFLRGKSLDCRCLNGLQHNRFSLLPLKLPCCEMIQISTIRIEMICKS